MNYIEPTRHSHLKISLHPNIYIYVMYNVNNTHIGNNYKTYFYIEKVK